MITIKSKDNKTAYCLGIGDSFVFPGNEGDPYLVTDINEENAFLVVVRIATGCTGKVNSSTKVIKKDYVLKEK